MHGLIEGLDKGAFKGPVWHQAETESEILGNAMTAEQARQKALNWEPILVPTYARAGGNEYVQVPGTFQVVRNDLPMDDPRRFISTGRGVGRKYKMIDNRMVADVVGALTQNGAHVVSTFSIFGGQRVVMVAQLGAPVDIHGDGARLYLVVTTAHDGTAAMYMLVSATRVVCWNTLSAAMRDHTMLYKVHHRKNAVERIAEASQIIATASESFGAQVDILRALAKVKMPDERAAEWVDKVIVGDSPQATTARNKVWTLYKGQQVGYDDATAVQDTAYGLFSALTEYTERGADNGGMVVRAHKDALEKQRDRFDVRANSVLFGAGARVRQRAFNMAVALL